MLLVETLLTCPVLISRKPLNQLKCKFLQLLVLILKLKASGYFILQDRFGQQRHGK